MKKIKILKFIISIVLIIFLTLFGTWLLVEDKKEYDKAKSVASSQNEMFEPLEEISTSLTETTINENNGKLDINTATKEELDSLDGIGPVLAERIIEFRKHKPFKTIYDLKKVSGIGDKKFKDIEEYITVNR